MSFDAKKKEKRKIRLINNLRPTLPECRAFTSAINSRVGRIVKYRTSLVDRNVASTKVMDDILKFSLWINIVTIGAIVAIFISTSQFIFYKDCESYYVAIKFIEYIKSASRIYLMLLGFPFWTMVVFYSIAIVISVSTSFVPTRRMISMFHSELGAGFLPTMRAASASVGVVSIALWFHALISILPTVFSEYSFETVKKYHHEAAIACKEFNKEMKALEE